MTLPVNIIGWRIDAAEPLELRPQFDNPVAVRVFAGQLQLGPMECRLRWEGAVLVADIDLPELAGETVRAFCMTDVEVEPITGIRRRRISLVDVKISRGT